MLVRLAKNLLRADNAQSILAAASESLALLCADEVLLQSNGRIGEVNACFDSQGTLQRSGTTSPLSQWARHVFHASLSAQAGLAAAPGCGSVIVVPFPISSLHGGILASWNFRLKSSVLHRAVSVLEDIADLIGARLDGLEKQSGREDQLAARCKALAKAGAHHEQALTDSESAAAEARESATTDILTDLQNRRGFMVKAEQCLILAQRQRLACAVIFADVDGLKRINDQYGHAAGDELIRHSASIFKSAFRHSDVVARLGGDEFAAFTFDNATPTTILDRIDKKVVLFNQGASCSYHLSLSVGVITCDPVSSESLNDYLKRADQKMYQQKRQRLHVVIANNTQVADLAVEQGPPLPRNGR